MKKFLTLAVVALVAVAQAGSVSWKATNVYTGNDTTLANGVAYFLSTDMYSAEEMQKLLDGEIIVKNNAEVDLAAALDGKYSFAPSSFNNGAGTYSSSTAGVSTSDLGLPAAQSVTVYLVIFDGDSIDTSSGGFMTTTKTLTTPGASASTTAAANFLSQKTASQNSENWKTGFAVPEPASALLMLVGAGLLAIRRKRA